MSVCKSVLRKIGKTEWSQSFISSVPFMYICIGTSRSVHFLKPFGQFPYTRNESTRSEYVKANIG